MGPDPGGARAASHYMLRCAAKRPCDQGPCAFDRRHGRRRILTDVSVRCPARYWRVLVHLRTFVANRRLDALGRSKIHHLEKFVFLLRPEWISLRKLGCAAPSTSRTAQKSPTQLSIQENVMKTLAIAMNVVHAVVVAGGLMVAHGA